MNADKEVWVAVQTVDGIAVPYHIFKSLRRAFQHLGDSIQMRYGDAVEAIRHQLFVRSQGKCEKCGGHVDEENGHMHEQKWRGRGGEISLENSLFICPECHQFAHKERNPRWKQ